MPQFKFLNFAFFRCRNINPFSTYFAGPHYDVLHYDVYLFSAEVSFVPWQVSFKLSSLSIMHSVPILYNSTHYLHVCVAMIVSWNFSPTFKETGQVFSLRCWITSDFIHFFIFFFYFYRPFSSQWWIWLALTGLFLASSIG